jgi:hypothetical protein
MARHQPLWQTALSYPAQNDRFLMAALWPAGAALGGVVTAVAGTMNVSVAAGSAGVPLALGEGGALCHWDAAEVVTLPAAPPAGQARDDLVIVQVRDPDIDGGANNDFIVTALTGTPAAYDEVSTQPAAGDVSPLVAPPVPANALALAEVRVVGGQANLNTATISDRRLLGLAVTPSIHARYYRSGAWNFGPTPGALGFENMVYDPNRLYRNGTGFTVPIAGVWRMTVRVGGQVPVSPTPNWFQALVRQANANVCVGGINVAQATAHIHAIAEYTARASAGTVWVPATVGGGGTAGIPGIADTTLTIDYLGP